MTVATGTVPAAPPRPFAAANASTAAESTRLGPAPGGAPASASPSVAPAAVTSAAGSGQLSRVKLVLIRPDGSEGGTFQLNEGVTIIGKETAPLFAGDSYLGPKHATFTVNGTTISVRDEQSLNGVYLRIERQQPVEVKDTDIFRIGQEILRFDAYRAPQNEPDGTEKQGAQIEGLVGKISLLIGRDTTGNAFPVPVTGLFLGRERGDILFPEDGYVSGLHCQLSYENGRVMLTDVGSSNGTYVRLRSERAVRVNDLVLLGQQLFRIVV